MITDFPQGPIVDQQTGQLAFDWEMWLRTLQSNVNAVTVSVTNVTNPGVLSMLSDDNSDEGFAILGASGLSGGGSGSTGNQGVSGRPGMDGLDGEDSFVVGLLGNLSGPITSSNSVTAVSSQTGTGSTFVMQASPTLTTPTIGAALATSVNFGDTSLSVYKEGTFTPTLNAFTIVNGTGAISTTGYYTKIGRVVLWGVDINGTGTATIASIANTSNITGIPYTASERSPFNCQDGSIAMTAPPGNVEGNTMYTPSWTAIAPASAGQINLTGWFIV